VIVGYPKQNKGPGDGGSYGNEYNHLEIGGETHPTEPRAMNATAMAAQGSQDNRGSIGGSQSSGEGAMLGGNRGSTTGDPRASAKPGRTVRR
jgi:hypothetical protein